jgi:hypothetical protein
MGIRNTATVRTPSEFAEAISRARTEAGPCVVVAKVREVAPTTKPPLDCVFIKQRFMQAIGNAEAGTEGMTVLKS